MKGTAPGQAEPATETAAPVAAGATTGPQAVAATRTRPSRAKSAVSRRTAGRRAAKTMTA